jgi:hypothetical protein
VNVAGIHFAQPACRFQDGAGDSGTSNDV